MQEEKMLCFQLSMMPGLDGEMCDIAHRGAGDGGFWTVLVRCIVCIVVRPPDGESRFREG